MTPQIVENLEKHAAAGYRMARERAELLREAEETNAHLLGLIAVLGIDGLRLLRIAKQNGFRGTEAVKFLAGAMGVDCGC